jgi:hypothetical protein
MPDKNWGTQSLTPAQQQSLSDVLQRFDLNAWDRDVEF